MNITEKIQYILSFLGLLLICVAGFDLLFLIPDVGPEFLYLNFAVEGVWIILLISLLRHNIALMMTLGFPSYDILRALSAESKKAVPSDNPVLRPYLTMLHQERSAEQLADYKRVLPFCAYMALPKAQKGFQSVLLVGVLYAIEAMGYGGYVALPAMIILSLFALCRIIGCAMDFL